jgi:hypothetical protein
LTRVANENSKPNIDKVFAANIIQVKCLRLKKKFIFIFFE